MCVCMCMENFLNDISKVMASLDDIKIKALNDKLYLQHLDQVLTKLDQLNILINKEKNFLEI